MTDRRPPIIIPLDGLERKEAHRIASELSGNVYGCGGNDLLDGQPGGASAVLEFSHYGPFWADAKLHDIPNTVFNRMGHYVEAEAAFVTVHALGGVEMMKAAVAAARSSRTKVIAVTVLTSHKKRDILDRYSMVSEALTEILTHDAIEAGVDGIVCSPADLLTLKERVITTRGLHEYARFRNMLKITPGIRPAQYKKPDDQQRVATPRGAIEAGADLLVMGRPILEAENPTEAVINIYGEIYDLL